MDYFESQLKQAPVRDIRLLMHQSVLIGELLTANGFSRVESLTSLPIADAFNIEQLISYWPAVAALSPHATEPVV